MIGKLRSLEILKLNIHKMKELPKEVGHLTQLRLLNVSGCKRLRLIPRNVLSSLKFLEELYMLGCAIEWEAEDNASLSELKNLHKLKTLELKIKDASTFPKDLYDVANHWEKYKITVGTEDYSHRQHLNFNKEACKSLDLSDLGASCVYKSMNDVVKMLLTNSEKLYLADLECVEDIHPGLNGDGSLPTQAYHMLKLITVENCNKLKNLLLWSHITNLSQLRERVISKCHSMKAIIAEESSEIETIELPELRYLLLYNLPNLVSFCSVPHKIVPSSALIDKKVEMPSLETMVLVRINTHKIWDVNLPTYSCVQNLTNLAINDCNNLKILFPSSVARALVRLQRLEIMCCKMVEKIFEEEENPMNQESLLNPLSSEQVILPNLEELKIECLENLRSPWCNQMAPNSFYKLSEVEITYCHKLINAFSSSVLNHLLNLERLQIMECDDLHVIIEKSENDEVRRVNLETLDIHSCRKNIATSLVVFPNLSVLKVGFCDEIANIMSSPSAAASLPNLQVLKIYSCDMMEEIVASENNDDGGAVNEIAFIKLEVLELTFLDSLKCFCQGAYTFKFPSLHIVHVTECPRMETFCNGNLIAPKLSAVVTSWPLSETFTWDGDLNTTIKNIFTRGKTFGASSEDI
ncbi:hypothetical protein PIB30_053739 [Stylosanthes scabra]|uniref:Uncharacterized protein n=1 Tax=Stylosanthes scabra TaxID=79078 RepID=A0ABU6XIV0_9FABA|nr:hypothetical protein [Stylosanthes scabra]